LKNLIIGFILGYLTFAFVQGGVDSVAYHIGWAFAEIQRLFESLVLWIQNYTPQS